MSDRALTDDEQAARERLIAASMSGGLTREEAEDVLRRVGDRLAGDHRGQFVWADGAELLWECDDACPHRSHEEQP